MFSIRKNKFNMKFITMKASQNYKEKKYSMKNHVLFSKTIKWNNTLKIKFSLFCFYLKKKATFNWKAKHKKKLNRNQ